MRGNLEHWARIATALIFGLAAAVTVLVAFQERATADFLADLARTPVLGRDTGSAPYYAAFWFDIGLALVLVVTAVLIARIGGRTWFGVGLLVAAVGSGVGLVGLLSAHAEVRTAVPLPAVAGVLVGLGALGLVTSLIGLASSAELPFRPPANPPVPPWHQAG